MLLLNFCGLFCYCFTMSGRQYFTLLERACLQKLIVKYRLNATATSAGAVNPALKKKAWANLTDEYNSIETNSKRTEAQLKKCWDNMKTRKKKTLAKTVEDGTICDSVKNSGDPDHPRVTASPIVVSQDIDEDLSVSVTSDIGDGELQYILDNDFDAEDVKNVRAGLIEEELQNRQQNYKRSREREEELHRLNVAERELRRKTAEEVYRKACVERRAATELLYCNRAKRRAAELSLLELTNKSKP